MEEAWLKELAEDEGYQQLIELKTKHEEELANKNEALFKEIQKLPPKPVQLDLETEDGPVKIQIMPEMRLYLNGKEEKPRL